MALASSAMLIAFGVTAGHGRAASGQPVPCITGSPYAASATQLAACGLSEVPLASTTALPGGGTAYNYATPAGVTYSVNQPPPGFDPTTAPPAQDAQYGLPDRPALSSPAYASWLTLVQAPWATEPQRPYLVMSDAPLTQPQPSTNDAASPDLTQESSPSWSGYTMAGTGWTEAETVFNEPTFGNTSCTDPSAASFWAGIGNQSAALGQDGTASGAGTPGLHQGFIEALPANAVFPGPIPSPGTQVVANTRYLGSGHYSFLLQANGISHSYSATNAGYDGSVVETIAERPKANGKRADLLNYQTVTMQSYDGKNLIAMNPSKEWNMTGYATTGPFANARFTATQNSCDG